MSVPAVAKDLKWLMFLVGCPDGSLHCMEESKTNFPEYFSHGVGIDGSSIPGFTKTEKSDVLLMPDPKTVRSVDCHDEKLSFVLCDVHQTDGTVHPHCPRSCLQRVLARYEAHGLYPMLQSEIEFYLVRHGTLEPQDKAGYMSMPPDDKATGFRREVAELLEACGMSVRRIHHENGPGQNEVELNLQPALKNADDTVISMWLLQMLAAKHGLDCLLSPLPLGRTEAGNGLHQHMMVCDKDGKNMMADGKGHLSELGEHFCAGVLKYSDEVTAIFARTKESFDRFLYGHEAPVEKQWGYSNRHALVRVPAGSPAKVHPEFRAADASGSNYLLAAVLLEAGLRGIEEKLALQPEGVVSGRLPITVEDCHEYLRESRMLKELFGETLLEWFLSQPM